MRDRRALLRIVIDPKLRVLGLHNRVDPIHRLTGLVGVEIEPGYPPIDEVVLINVPPVAYATTIG